VTLDFERHVVLFSAKCLFLAQVGDIKEIG